MNIRAVCALAALAAVLGVCRAHVTLMFAGGSKEKYQYIVPSDMGNAPVKDVTSPEMICRAQTIKTAGVDKLKVTAGQDFGVQWQHINGSKSSPNWPVMSPSHNGPCIFYMSQLEKGGTGAVWFKTSQEGYDEQAKKWCTNKVIDAYGNYRVPVPKNIPNGDYLVRTELIALHQATTVGGAQFYPNCVVVTVSGGTGSTLPELYDITKVYSPNDPGIKYDRGTVKVKPYQVPGPKPLITGTKPSTKPGSTTP
ncbi:hypothetical protein H4R18_005969 [Coemansia javaensis]|uniref:lytic cellulose monooxygenase (C4-dehydrogenating) n=1 Tax=Coemansia javaensis TaxID=2761396 RepID=A0A9W8LE47_9FUNG|nr:hypothetical protein H4R18_005970 [Coemansia javaensis]KAJ2775644.1 hypothetical protein H4R18_005969 [Coemansia javaensis]